MDVRRKFLQLINEITTNLTPFSLTSTLLVSYSLPPSCGCGWSYHVGKIVLLICLLTHFLRVFFRSIHLFLI
jgi:hypothetical protein